MMKAKFLNSELMYDFDEFDLLTLVIENRTALFKYLRYLNNDFRGEESYWKIAKDNDSIPIDEVADFIPNLFSLEINSKKNVNALYKILKKTYYEKLREEMSSLKDKVSKIIKEICLDFDLELVISNDLKEDDLFKIMDLRFEDSGLSEKEKVIKYCITINELRGVCVFFFVSLHTFFSDEDLSSMINELKYRRIKLFNLETSSILSNITRERVLIFDNDLCVIS